MVIRYYLSCRRSHSTCVRSSAFVIRLAVFSPLFSAFASAGGRVRARAGGAERAGARRADVLHSGGDKGQRIGPRSLFCHRQQSWCVMYLFCARTSYCAQRCR